METIIGLLIVLVPVILKVIAKRREKSASADEELTYPVESIAMPAAEEPVSEEESVREPSPAVKPASAITPVSEEKEVRKDERIDPKKLVIYSEIMKTKF